MSISLESSSLGPSAMFGKTSSATDHSMCPNCVKPITDTHDYDSYTGSPSGSPMIMPPGPLAAAAFDWKAIWNVSRVCNAVARGDLSQKITVTVQGIFMVQLKDVIDTMVDKLGQFAKEVTCISQEVGTEGKLGGQALVLDVEGTWRELTSVVNNLAANLTSKSDPSPNPRNP